VRPIVEQVLGDAPTVVAAAEAAVQSALDDLVKLAGGRIDAKARGLSPSASASENQALMMDLIGEAATMGQELWIGDGDFPMDTIDLSGLSNLVLNGTGTILQDALGAMLTASGVDNLQILGIGLKGAYTSGAMAGGEAISLTDATNVQVSRARISNWGTTAIGLTNVKDSSFAENEFDTIAGTSIRPHTTWGEGRRNERLYLVKNKVIHSCVSGQMGNGAFQHSVGGNIHRDIWYLENYVEDTYVGFGMDWGENIVIHRNSVKDGVGEGIAMTGLNYDVAHNIVSGFPGAAGILFWTEIGTKGLRCTYNDVTGCAQGLALVWGDPGSVIDDVHASHNRFNGNGQGVLSYAHTMPGDDPVENYAYGDVTVCFNDVKNNTNASIVFSPADAGGSPRHFGNWDGAGMSSTLSGANAAWDILRTFAGDEDTESVEYAVLGTHRDGLSTSNPSELRMWAGFDQYLWGSKGAGLGARKRSAWANSVDLVLYNWNGQLEEAATFHAAGLVEFGGAVAQPVRTITADTTLDATARTVLVDASGGDVLVTLPFTGAMVAGTQFFIKRIDTSANVVTIDAFMTEWIDGANQSFTLDAGGDYMTLVCQEPGWWIEGRSPESLPPTQTLTASGDADPLAQLILVDATAGPVTVALPYTATVEPGHEVTIKKTDNSANVVTVDTFMTEQIDGANQSFLLDRRYASMRIRIAGEGVWQRLHYTEPLRTVLSLTATGDVLANHALVLADATAGPVTVNLPYTATLPPGHRVTIKKIDASANAVTIDGYLTEQIEGAQTRGLASQWASAALVYGAEGVWYVE
jgi:hypothetical protein